MDATDAFALADLDAIGQAALVAAGELSASELLDAAIVRLEATRELNAVIADLFDRGRAAGRRAGRVGRARDRRCGSAGRSAVPAQGPRRIARGHAGGDGFAGAAHPRRDGDGVDRRAVPAAGLVVFGKTNTPEWGNHCTTEPSLFGPTVNPWSPSITPGGSSGGSAAAVAAGVVPAASGGDGTGSIRVPASCCGLVGLKPRRGRTSFAPGRGHGLEGLVNEHALTRTVRDSAALLDVVAGAAPGDPVHRPCTDGAYPATRSRSNPPRNGF